MEPIKTEFVDYMQQKQHEAGQTQGQAQNIDGRNHRLFAQTTQGAFQVILNHGNNL